MKDQANMTDKNFPNPEEVQKEFEDFVKQRFGNQVQIFTNSVGPQADKDVESFEDMDDDKEHALDFNMKPKDIKAYLDQYVIRQDEAKKALAIAVCDHYNHVKASSDQDQSKAYDYAKQNVLILGPTGVGKTYMIRKVAELIGVPFVKADATRFSETGYVGANVDDLVRDLVQQANGDIYKAQHGIVYLDEADKLASPTSRNGRDVTGRGVQFGLLRLMEETDVDLRSGNDMQSQIQAMMDFQKGKTDRSVVNTANILFIVSGAFTGMEDIIKKRLHSSALGFGAPTKSQKATDQYFDQVTTEDLIDFGFEPEFVGRLPIRVACKHLAPEDLYDILKESHGSVIKQYISAFEAYGIDIKFTDEALQEIARLAHVQKTGARALMTVCEKVLRSFKYELPSSHIQSFTVTKELIDDPADALEALLSLKDEKSLNEKLKEILAYEQFYSETYNLNITFSQEAAEIIARQSLETGDEVKIICDQLLNSYEHGLKLIHQSTGQEQFFLDKEVIQNPKSLLEKMIRDTFQN